MFCFFQLSWELTACSWFLPPFLGPSHFLTRGRQTKMSITVRISTTLPVDFVNLLSRKLCY